MTGNVLIDLAISAAGIAILVSIAWGVFGARSAPMIVEVAAARLDFDEPDFEPVEWLLSDAGDAALARNASGEAALLVVHGDGLVTRRFPAGAMPARHESGRLTIDRPDHTARPASFALNADKAALWLPSMGVDCE